MGIGNLNNNFGWLTTGKVANNNDVKNNKNVEKLDITAKTNADLLNSATLGDKEGKIFDSNNINDGSDVLYARAKGKGKKPKTWTEFQKDQWDKVGGAENYTGEDAALFGAGVWLVGTIYHSSRLGNAWQKL